MSTLKELINEGQQYNVNLKQDYFGNDCWVNETLQLGFLTWARKVSRFIKNNYPDSGDNNRINEELEKDQGKCCIETYRFVMSILKSLDELECLDERDLQKVNVLEQILYSFSSFVRQLNRRYNNRQGIIISDEYDVQDLLHAQLVTFFEDVRAEDPVPICAGRSSRLDFLISDLKTAVEVKMTRNGLEDKAIGDQILQDLGRYPKHGDIERLVFFIFDPDKRIQNPKGLKEDIEKLSRDNYKL